jgi:hypothetical protein
MAPSGWREVQVEHDDRAALAAEALVYGFPLVFDLQEVDRFTSSGIGGVPATPFNRFGHASTLAGPEDRFVSINNDTVYSIAQLDLSAGPVRLGVPDTGGRYYVLQFVDAWTNNFADVGHRATGTRSGSFLLAPPGDGEHASDQAPVIRFPTAVATIVGRWAVDGEDDLPAVQALQAGLTLTPLGGRAGRGLPRRARRSPRSCGSSSGCGSGCRRSRPPSGISTTSGGSAPWGCWSRPHPMASPTQDWRPRSGWASTRAGNGWSRR